jgi:heptosyltransferase-2
VDPAAAARLAARLEARGVAAARSVVLVPGATYGPAKRWPGFAALAQSLPAALSVLIAGAPAERALCGELRAALAREGRAVVDLCGELDLAQLAALLAAARCTISNDTGPMHLAAAVGGRVLGLFLSTAPEWTAPRGPSARWLAAAVPCRPCFARDCPLPAQLCGEAISATAVREAIADWLAPEAA